MGQRKRRSTSAAKPKLRVPTLPGLFTSSASGFNTRAWHDTLRNDAGSCKLLRLEFCKATSEKLHEFIVSYFSHPQTDACAVAIVDRVVPDRSRTSAIILPSSPFQSTMEALDRVHVVGQGENLSTYLAKAYDKYDKLCVLKYMPSAQLAPSAIQFSNLLLVATNHRPNYNLYRYNCYWYANTVFEACKELFPSYKEECNKHEHHGQCRLNTRMLAMDSLSGICNEYNLKRGDVLQWREQEQQEWTRKLEKERRTREAAQQEWERKLEEERRAGEVQRQQLERKLEEMERRCKQLEVELEAAR